MMKISTVDLAFWIGRGDAEIGSGSRYERYLLIFLLCLGLMILYRRRFDWYKALKDNIWLIVLICYMFVSIFWSETPYTSFKRWTRELIAVIMAFLILTEADPRQAVQGVLKRSIYVLIPFSLLLVFFFPDIGTKEYAGGAMVSWNGITGGKNLLGRLCLISILFLIWSLVKNWQKRDTHDARHHQMWIDVVILSVAVFLMKGPGIGKMLSITSVMILFLGLATLFGLQLMKRFKRGIGLSTLKTFIVACIVLGTVSVFAGGLVVGESVTTAIGREETLTGRSEIWAMFVPHVMEEPLLGYGVGGFWTDKRVKTYRLNQAHSGYLDILLDYGFIGLIFFSLFLLSSSQKAHKELSHNYNWGSLLICFLIMSTIYNVAEATLDSLTSDLTATILFLYVITSGTTATHVEEKNEYYG
jgi:O-antigen ligase